jgi:2-oxo-4-hydroxy-4-carboxy-5-ureidoimidazoline decarboxylase
MTLADVNLFDRERFIQALGWVFENSPWVAERAFAAKPFRDIEALHQAMQAQVMQAKPEEQLALLRAHPDLGTRARVSDASKGEQAGAGLDRLTPGEFERLTELNAKYRDKFGFPFLFAVKGSTKQQILRALEERLPASRDDEYRVALEQVSRIAKFRLEDSLI